MDRTSRAVGGYTKAVATLKRVADTNDAAADHRTHTHQTAGSPQESMSWIRGTAQHQVQSFASRAGSLSVSSDMVQVPARDAVALGDPSHSNAGAAQTCIPPPYGHSWQQQQREEGTGSSSSSGRRHGSAASARPPPQQQRQHQLARGTATAAPVGPTTVTAARSIVPGCLALKWYKQQP